MKNDAAENMIIAALDQDWSESVEKYDALSQEERGILAKWLMKDSASGAPSWVASWIRALASIAFLETGLRWNRKLLQSSEE